MVQRAAGSPTTTTMARLSDLLAELDVVDKLAEGHVNKLVSNISDWSSSKNAEKVFYHPGDDWTWRSIHFNEIVLTKFLTLNKCFTKAMEALIYYSDIEVSRRAGKCVESWAQRFQLYRRTRKPGKISTSCSRISRQDESWMTLAIMKT
jgi:hypothetical protein